METFRDILYRQTDTLQSYFDTCAEKHGNDISHHAHLDMRDEEDDVIGKIKKTTFQFFLKVALSYIVNYKNIFWSVSGIILYVWYELAQQLTVSSHWCLRKLC